jgi:hypothetical protein
MAPFPRTRIENLSVSRMIIGTNWFLGYSHCSKAKDKLINDTMTAARIADILEVFLSAGIDALLGFRPEPKLVDGIKEAENRTGRACIRIAIPSLDLSGTPAAESANERLIAEYAALGTRILMPHQCTTDALLDKRAGVIRDMNRYTAMVRSHGMIPGLSTHMPETPRIADQSGLDVATYIQIYNAAGFLMQVEADWVHRIIWEARKPVIAIKPLAAGRLLPLVGLSFAWSTLRAQDMVCVGTSSPDEATEVIEISSAILEHRCPNVELQKTRSKQALNRA